MATCVGLSPLEPTKILKTRPFLAQLETDSVETNLKCVCTRLGLQSGPSSEDQASKDQRTPPRKRQLEAAHEVIPPEKRSKRQQPLDTPTKRVIQQTAAPQTPAVSVSAQC